MSKMQILQFACISLLSDAALCQKIEPPYEIIQLNENHTVQLRGFLDYRGETIFYTSQNAKRLRLVFPYCISGTSGLAPQEIAALSKHKVKVDAEVVGIKPIADGEGITTDVLIAGSPIKNWCLGDKALRILSVRRAD